MLFDDEAKHQFKQQDSWWCLHRGTYHHSVGSQSFRHVSEAHTCRESFEVAEFIICSWDSMKPALSFSTSVIRQSAFYICTDCLQSTTALPECLWLAGLLIVQSLETSLCLPWIAHVELDGLIVRLPTAVPASGMSNPQWGLCWHHFVYYVSWNCTPSVDELLFWWINFVRDRRGAISTAQPDHLSQSHLEGEILDDCWHPSL